LVQVRPRDRAKEGGIGCPLPAEERRRQLARQLRSRFGAEGVVGKGQVDLRHCISYRWLESKTRTQPYSVRIPNARAVPLAHARGSAGRGEMLDCAPGVVAGRSVDARDPPAGLLRDQAVRGLPDDPWHLTLPSLRA